MDCQNFRLELGSSNWTCKIGGSQHPTTTTQTSPGQNPSSVLPFISIHPVGTEYVCPPPDSYAEALTPNVVVFGRGALVR